MAARVPLGEASAEVERLTTEEARKEETRRIAMGGRDVARRKLNKAVTEAREELIMLARPTNPLARTRTST